MAAPLSDAALCLILACGQISRVGGKYTNLYTYRHIYYFSNISFTLILLCFCGIFTNDKQRLIFHIGGIYVFLCTYRQIEWRHEMIIGRKKVNHA